VWAEPTDTGQKNSDARPNFTTLSRDTLLAEELDVLHKWNNQLGIILGECAVLAQDAKDPNLLMRLQGIQNVAHSIGDEVARRQGKIAEVMRSGA